MLPEESVKKTFPDSQRRGTWWNRNWKWFVPVGCLTLLLLFAGFVAAIFGLAFGALKSTDVYQQAVERVRQSEDVQAALGTPIEEGWFASGKVNVMNDTGEASIGFPISGPKGRARVAAMARRDAGQWRFTRLEVKVEGSQRLISLPTDLPAK